MDNTVAKDMPYRQKLHHLHSAKPSQKQQQPAGVPMPQQQQQPTGVPTPQQQPPPKQRQLAAGVPTQQQPASVSTSQQKKQLQKQHVKSVQHKKQLQQHNKTVFYRQQQQQQQQQQHKTAIQQLTNYFKCNKKKPTKSRVNPLLLRQPIIKKVMKAHQTY